MMRLSHYSTAKVHWMMLAITVFYDYKIWHMHVNMTFLNGFIQEVIYMEQPCEFVSFDPRQVCLLKRSI